MADLDGDRERTGLAVERTMLAWWRTGLAALAVALAVGRLLPELSPEQARKWPYVLLGLVFALYACGLFGFGAYRGQHDGTAGKVPAFIVVMAGAGIVLSVATVVLIAAAA